MSVESPDAPVAEDIDPQAGAAPASPVEPAAPDGTETMAADSADGAVTNGAAAATTRPEIGTSASAASTSATAPDAAAGRSMGFLRDVELELTVELGRSRLPLRELLTLTPGTVLELDRNVNEPVDLLVNGSLVARGQVVVIGDDFGVRLEEIINPRPER